jgi:AcrR family transcriptional regulator
MPKIVDIEVRRVEVANAAARLIARGGVEAATMRDVAAEAGLTTGSVTHYFADKRELLLFTLTESLQRRRSRRSSAAAADPRRALRASLEGALPADADRRRHWMVTIAFCAHAAGDAELAAVQRNAYREFRDTVARQLVECGMETGHVHGEAERLIAVVDGVAVQALFDPQHWSARRQMAVLDAALANLSFDQTTSKA